MNNHQIYHRDTFKGKDGRSWKVEGGGGGGRWWDGGRSRAAISWPDDRGIQLLNDLMTVWHSY